MDRQYTSQVNVNPSFFFSFPYGSCGQMFMVIHSSTRQEVTKNDKNNWLFLHTQQAPFTAKFLNKKKFTITRSLAYH